MPPIPYGGTSINKAWDELKISLQITMVTADLNTVWRPRDAWFCLAAIVTSQVLIAAITFFLSLRGNYDFAHSALGVFIAHVIASFVALLITFKFARTRTVTDFKERFGIRIPGRATVVISIVAGAIIGGFSVISSRLESSIPTNALVERFEAIDDEGITYLDILILLSPLVEEIMFRGYVYKAFRQGYSVATSISIMLVFTMLTHLGPVTTSITAAGAMLVLTVTLCILREKTASLWNCVVCHLIYNALCVLV